MKKLNGRLVIYIIIIICLITGFKFGSRFFNGKLTISKITKKVKPKIVYETLTDKDISLKTLNWLNEQRDKNNKYIETKECEINNSQNCKEGIVSNRNAFSVLWARYEYIKKFGDEKQLNILKKDIELFSDRKKVELIQNNYYNCYFLYDLWQSNLFSEKEKQEIEKICFDSSYELLADDLRNIGILSGEIKYKNNIEELLEEKILFVNSKVKDLRSNLKNVNSNSNSNISPADYILKKYPFYVTDLKSRFEWKNDPNYLISAYYLLNVSLDRFLDKQSLIGSKEVCALGTAVLSLYEINRDENFFKLSEEIFRREIKKELGLDELSECTLLANNLFKESNHPDFLNARIYLNERLVRDSYDSEATKGKIINEGGFGLKGKTTFIKNIQDNGLIIGLILQ